MKKHHQLLASTVLALIGQVMLPSTTNAATIHWTASPATTSGSYGQTLDTGLFDNTDVVYAENTGGAAQSFDGINFSAGTITFAGTDGGFHEGGWPSQTGTWSFSGPSTVTLGTGSLPALTIGQRYKIQLLVFDGRASVAGRTVSLDGNNQGTYANGVYGLDYGDGLLVTGTFTADATTQAFTIEAFDGATSRGGQLNALVVNTLPAATVTSTPTFSPPGGGYVSAQSVTLTADSGSTIYYTTDGSDPTTSGTRTFGSSPLSGIVVPIDTTETIKAYAILSGFSDSAVTSVTYRTYSTTAPTDTWGNPAGGNWSAATNWSDGFVANGIGITADFSTLTLTANTSVTLDTLATVGKLVFADQGNTYTWSVLSGSLLTLATLTGTPEINVSNQSVTIGSALIGTQGLTKTGPGNLTLNGNNTYNGTTTIIGGTLQVGNGGSTGSLGSGNIVNNGTLIYSLNSSGAITLPSSVTGSGTLTATARDIWLNGNITLGGSQSYTQTGGGGAAQGIRLFADTTLTGPSISMTGDVGQWNDIGSKSLTLDTSAVNGTIDLNVSTGRPNVWYGIAGFTANAGTGTININGTGPASSGFGGAASSNNLNGTINISSNLSYLGAVTLNGPITISGNIDNTGPAVFHATANSTISGNINLNQSLYGYNAFNVDNGFTMTMSGKVDGVSNYSYGGINKQGAGTLILTYAANAYLQGMQLNGGTVEFASGALHNSASPVTGYAADFQIDSTLRWSAGNTDNITQIKIGDGVTATLDTGANNVALNTAFDLGTLKTGALTKAGTGTLTLSATNTYTGNTTVNAGTLVLAETTGQLAFTIGANDVNNKITGAGAATLNGKFSLNLTGAVPTTGNSWTLVDRNTLTGESFGASFSLVGFPVVTGSTPGERVHSYDDGTHTWTFTEADGKLTVAANSQPGYADWAATNAPTGTSADDYDNDGVSNGAEWVLGGTKDSNDLDKLPKVTTPDGDVVFTFLRDQNSKTLDTTLNIQVGTTLESWPDVYAVPNDPVASNPGVTVVDNLAGFDIITLRIPRSPAASKFARLQVVVP